MDITKEWTKTKGKKGSVAEKQSYMVDGTEYKVDGIYVILHPTENERKIASILSGEYGKMLNMCHKWFFHKVYKHRII